MGDDSNGKTVFGTTNEERQTVEKSEPNYKDKNWLYNQYVNLKKSIPEIANEYGWPTSTLEYWFQKHEIPMRDLQESASIGKKKHANYRNKEWLNQMYHERNHSVSDLADKCDTTRMVIRRWMNRFGIERRSIKEGNKIIGQERVEGKEYTNEGWLREQYENKLKSVTDIAEECDVTHRTIQRWLDRNGIETRTPAETTRAKTNRQYSMIRSSDNNSVKTDGESVRLDLSWKDSTPGENVIYPLAEPEILERLYWEKKMSLNEMADYIGCSVTTIQDRFELYNIPTRSVGEGLKEK